MVLLATALVFFFVAAPAVDNRMNTVRAHPPCHASDASDNITLRAAAERRPLDNWLTSRHLLARARSASEKLKRGARSSGDQLRFVT